MEGAADDRPEAEQIEELGDEIVRLSDHLQVMNRRYRELTAERDRLRGEDAPSEGGAGGNGKR